LNIFFVPCLNSPESEFVTAEVQETDSDFLQGGTMQYHIRDISFEEEDFFSNKLINLGPSDPLFFLFKDQVFVFVFSRREFFADEDEEMAKRLIPVPDTWSGDLDQARP
jgi:hypothetical protein